MSVINDYDAKKVLSTAKYRQQKELLLENQKIYLFEVAYN